MEGVYIMVGLTTGWQNERKGRRLRRLRWVEQRLRKQRPRKVLRNQERIGRPKQDGALVDRKSFVLNALKCFRISRLSVSKVEVLEGSIEGKH